jgi:hypothetical protein
MATSGDFKLAMDTPSAILLPSTSSFCRRSCSDVCDVQLQPSSMSATIGSKYGSSLVYIGALRPAT